ncbi:MAG TPA: squalene/phytoene synthase family protein, partial [Paracoccaceae bacterium]|nr:squalene/phytoene synthase family protein [Paracoccaceae bacterium]
MTIAACAELVERGDPDRFLAAMAAPPAARARLFPLYAFNLEVARAPWVTAEPLIAEMRLQWWRDVVAASESGAARAHEVAAPLHALIREAGLPVAVLDALVAARRRDIDPEPWADEAELSAYLADTAGGLMWLSVRALGAADEAAARDAGWAMGLAAWFRAAPALAARGRNPLPDDDPQAVAALARQG